MIGAHPATPRRSCLICCVLIAVLTTSSGFEARARNSKTDLIQIASRSSQTTGSVRAARAAKSYAIEFRARYALSYGHAFVMFGPLNARGEFAERTVAGLHPAGEDPTPWMIGHLVPVEAETGPSDGDLEDQYVSAKYRVVLSREEYERVVAYIHQRQATSGRWHVLFNNCIQFIADIGRYVGLTIPPASADYPQQFIEQLRKLNEGNERLTAQSRADLKR